MIKGLITHVNLIGHEINQSISENHPASDREIYCKKLHKITEPEISDCDNCPYFGGLAQGNGHVCIWEEPIDISSPHTVIIPHQDRMKELMRVSEMIDDGALEKG